jgi:GT2 family glycosyltransferase
MNPGEPGPVISVVVPTVGRPHRLERCLAALEASELGRERFEVIVVDDSGGPETARVAEASALDPRLVEPGRSGPSGARNAGATAARGEFVAFTDDDCEPSPGWLTALQRALGAHPGAAVGGVTVNGVPDDKAAEASQAVVDAVHGAFNADPGAPRFFASSNLAFPAREFLAVGGFDERFRYAEDREMCERWLRAGHQFGHAPDAVVVHMRTMTLREFWRQHYGYGRGAAAFARSRRDAGAWAERPGIARELAVRARAGGPTLAAHLALSQVATAAGFAREEVAARLGRSGNARRGKTAMREGRRRRRAD